MDWPLSHRSDGELFTTLKFTKNADIWLRVLLDHK